jgi:hypothetical protein
VGGFDIVDAPDLGAALEQGRTVARAATLPIEVRPIQDDGTPQLATACPRRVRLRTPHVLPVGGLSKWTHDRPDNCPSKGRSLLPLRLCSTLRLPA